MSIKKTSVLLVLFFLIAISLSACQWQWWKKPAPAPDNNPIQAGEVGGGDWQAAGLKKFSTLEELKAFLEANAVVSSQLAYDSAVMGRPSAAPVAATMEVKRSAGAPGEMSVKQVLADYSKTNIQVAGVDEADIVKTDGQYIYAVADKNLQIIQAWPVDEAKLVATIKFESQPQDIYLSGQNLIIFGYDQAIYNKEIFKNFRRQSAYTFVKVFDLNNKAEPKQVRDLSFEGSYADSRLIGDYLYFITATPQYGVFDDAVLPRLLENGQVISQDKETDRYHLPAVYYFSAPYYGVQLVNVAAVNISDNQTALNSQVYLLPGAQSVYVSNKHLYLTHTQTMDQGQVMAGVLKEVLWPKISQDLQAKITKIEATENFILSEAEKMSKITNLLQGFVAGLSSVEQQAVDEQLSETAQNKIKALAKELEKTVITKIALDGKNLTYQASGAVPGSVLNQFSMDESGDNFRLATTKNPYWLPYVEAVEQESFSNVYVLDSGLKIIGSLENLAPGEGIYAARFMGQRAYLVTFQQTDPLLVIDLSQSQAPRVLGELQIPGFANYLQPYDDTTLIGLGKEAIDKNGRVVPQGLKLSLFDVADVGAPKEIAKYEMGAQGSDSIALSDHKAVLFAKDKNLLSIPVSLTKAGPSGSWGGFEFSGLAVFDISRQGFKLKGKIDHSDGGQAGLGEDWLNLPYYDNTVKRSLYIEDNLYSLSSRYIKINHLSDLSEIKAIKLKDSKDFEVISY